MYNFSGILYRIWGVCGIMFLLGVVCLLGKKPWVKGFSIKKCKLEFFMLAFAVILGMVHVSRIISPDVLSYTGVFLDSHRNSRVAPPLPLTREYVFWNGEGKKQVFYLDTFSKKEIFPSEFQYGKTYKVYFDDFTNVIVQVEVIE